MYERREKEKKERKERERKDREGGLGPKVKREGNGAGGRRGGVDMADASAGAR